MPYHRGRRRQRLLLFGPAAGACLGRGHSCSALCVGCRYHRRVSRLVVVTCRQLRCSSTSGVWGRWTRPVWRWRSHIVWAHDSLVAALQPGTANSAKCHGSSSIDNEFKRSNIQIAFGDSCHHPTASQSSPGLSGVTAIPHASIRQRCQATVFTACADQSHSATTQPRGQARSPSLAAATCSAQTAASPPTSRLAAAGSPARS